MGNQAKTCKECGRLLTLDHFRLTPLSADGHANICKDCAQSERAELTRWRDPKEEQPENGVCVLIKVDDQLGNKTIYLGSREGTEYLTDGGLVFGTESDANSEVIGWREIHE